jgi:hypothetical protein
VAVVLVQRLDSACVGSEDSRELCAHF